MEKIILTSLTTDDFKHMVIQAMKEVFHHSSPSSSNGNSKELMNIDEASTFLDIAKTTLYKFTSERKIPHIKKAKKLLFKRSELIAWLETAKKHTMGELMADEHDFSKLSSKTTRGRPTAKKST
jgi:excisionase family DNA binding protein